ETRDSAAIITYHETLTDSLQKMPASKESAVVEKFHPMQFQTINESLKSIEAIHKQLGTIIRRPHGVQFVADILNKVHIIERKFQRREELKAEIEREDIRYSDEFSYKTKLETDLDNFKTSDEYLRYDHLLGKKIKLEKALERETDAGRRIALNELFGDVQRQISGDMASRRVEDYKYKLTHVDAQVKLIEDRKKKFEQELKELQIEKDLLNVEKTISSLHPVKIQ
ncbi:MAG TPA: hypothetical protein VKE88_02870, partial [Candidatus Nanoarchaeia archaeon]|nr:hypothetical protein [Candidatus Nanoarchaeia archaeon]